MILAVLLLLCAGAGWMEINSYSETDQLRLARWSNTVVGADAIEVRAWYGYIRSSRGKVALKTLSFSGQAKVKVTEEIRNDSDGKTHYDWEWNEDLSTKREPEWMMVPKNYSNRIQFAGFNYGRFERRGGYYMGNSPNEVSVINLVLVPWPAVVGAFGIGPLWWMCERALRKWRRKRRVAMGRCGECGYDLRGSKGECPECGGKPRERMVREAHPTPEGLGGVK